MRRQRYQHLRQQLRASGFDRISQGGTEGLLVRTYGWKYRVTLDGETVRVEPENTSQIYQKLRSAVEQAIATPFPVKPLPEEWQNLPWRILTLYEPWASAIAYRYKRWETRPNRITWKNFRGVLLIRAARRPLDRDGKKVLDWLNGYRDAKSPIECSPGQIVAICHMANVFEMNAESSIPGRYAISGFEKSLGLWQPGRLAIQLKEVRAMPEPILWSQGTQGLQLVPESLQQQIWHRFNGSVWQMPNTTKD